MSRTPRTEKQIEKDHTQLAKEKSDTFKKILAAEVLDKPFWCHTREQQIKGPVCQKVQSTAGCKATLENCPLWDGPANLKAETKPGSKKSKSGKLSYQVIMKAHFLDKGVATLPELVDLINNHPSRKLVERQADNKNVSVGVSILKNPKRMKNPLRIEFSRLTGTYYCLDFKGCKELLESEEAKEKAIREAKKTEDKTTPSSDKPVIETHPAKPAQETAPAEIKDLSGYKLKGLRELAKEAKIKGFSSMTKKNLITALTK